MPAIAASAPGKVILFGEHAVVYGHPAIAVPVDKVMARAAVQANPRGTSGEVRILAPAINLDSQLKDLPSENPLAFAVRGVLSRLGINRPPACEIRITSTIPIASGMGSGVAVSVAVIRAVSAFMGSPMPDNEVSELAYEVERIYHGTPSGIDNTVVTYAVPVYFARGRPLETLAVPAPFTVVIGDTGISSPTSIAVGDVRRAWQENTVQYEQWFTDIGEISQRARQCIEAGKPQELGSLMTQNHALLQQIGVSSPELDRLVEVAISAGASGAKLSGAGRGGNMIALAGSADASEISRALLEAGASHVIVTEVKVPQAVRIASGGKT
jgi:mevalonate kinase